MTENEEQILKDLNTLVININNGQPSVPEFKFNSDDVSEPIKELSSNISLLAKNFQESQGFLSALAKGELDTLPPKNNLIGPFKQLHSDLLHLVWQTNEIAEGDYSQKVSFMGDFSISYNKLIEALKEKKKLEASLIKLNADKDRFITILAHDLKSPFNSILGFLEVLVKDLREFDIDKIEELINIVNDSAITTFKLLEAILLWVRANSGKIPYEPEDLNLEPICKDVVRYLKLAAESKNITVNLFSDSEINVYADENMLNTVLRNLVSNSIKFTNSNGHIDIYSEQNESNVKITVSDNGVGIKPDTLNKLFDNTEKVTTLGTEQEEGTGLGLFLCKEFIEKHGGKIWATSELGKGTSFQFTLPNQNDL